MEAPVAPFPGDLMVCSGPCRHLHTCDTPKLTLKEKSVDGVRGEAGFLDHWLPTHSGYETSSTKRQRGQDVSQTVVELQT